MYNLALNLVRFLVLTSSLLLAGCRSTDPTTGVTQVAGQVVESQTRKAVAGATVQVYHASSGGGYVPVGSAYPADATGHFAFSFDAANQYGYLVLASAPPGYFTDFGMAPSLTAGRSNSGLQIPMLAPAWVRIHLVDEAPKNDISSIYISGYENNGDRFNYPRDTTFIRLGVAGLTNQITWFITDNKGIETHYNKGVNLTALDTLTVRIPF